MHTPSFSKRSFIISCHLLVFAASFGNLPAAEEALPDFDKRKQELTRLTNDAPARTAAVSALTARNPAVRVDFDDVLAGPAFVHSRRGFLSGPDSEDEVLNPRRAEDPAVPEGDAADPLRKVKRFLDENRALYGHDACGCTE